MPNTSTTLDALSAMDQAAFTATLGEVFEYSPWVAERAWAARPFHSIDALHAAMMQVVRGAGEEAILALLRRHPELAARGYLTAASNTEQGGAGLTRLAPGEGAALAAANREYLGEFGFPFIVAVRGMRSTDDIRAAMATRMLHEPAAEIEVALGEVAKITRFRLDDMIGAA